MPTPRTPPLPTPALRQRFRRNLLAWYRKNGRDLPWRNTSDPYHILVSEIMLQQTQVDRVLPKYLEWLGKYPSFAVLAEAPPAEVTK
ncbi:MAG: A/G-specific adenine glycosylase, partial [Acidobacteriota bacterium]|nr:A/G-specific adenine glycosylase [Acidobacteriota bacterium]